MQKTLIFPLTMHANRSISERRRPAVVVRPGGSAGRAERRLRRVARRHSRVTLRDHIAFWLAHYRGRMHNRGRANRTWPMHVRVAVLMTLLVAGLAVGALVA